MSDEIKTPLSKYPGTFSDCVLDAHDDTVLIEEVSAELDRLREERDEAVRDVCHYKQQLSVHQGITGRELARAEKAERERDRARDALFDIANNDLLDIISAVDVARAALTDEEQCHRDKERSALRLKRDLDTAIGMLERVRDWEPEADGFREEVDDLISDVTHALTDEEPN